MFDNPIHPLNPLNRNSPLNPDYIDQYEKVEVVEQPERPVEEKSDAMVWVVCAALIVAVALMGWRVFQVAMPNRSGD